MLKFGIPTVLALAGGSNAELGLRADYFDGINLEGAPVFSRVEETFGIPFTKQPIPGTPLGADHYSVRWTGSVTSSKEQAATFEICGDDGYRLWVNGVQVLDQWKDQARTCRKTEPISFLKDIAYHFEAHYYENAGGAVCEFNYPEDLTFDSSVRVRLRHTAGPVFVTADTTPFSVRLSQAPAAGETVRVQVINPHPEYVTLEPMEIEFDSSNYNGVDIFATAAKTGTRDVEVTFAGDNNHNPEVFDDLQTPSVTIVMGVVNGLLANYYKGTTNFDENKFVETRIEPVLDFDVGKGALHNQYLDVFSIQYFGAVDTPTTGMYTFCVSSDDGTKLYMDGEEIVWNWQAQATNEECSQPIHMNAFQKVPIKIEYYELYSNCNARFSWIDPSGNQRTVPTEHLWVSSGPGVSTFPKTLAWDASDGGKHQFLVKLNTAPAADVTVTFENHGYAQAKLSSCSLTFTPENWMTPVPVFLVSNPTFGDKLTAEFNVDVKSTSADEEYNDNFQAVSIKTTSARSGTCTSWGDPHIISTDQTFWDFFGQGDFYLLRDPSGELVVQTRQLPCARSVTCNFGVVIKWQSTVVAFHIHEARPIMKMRSEVIAPGFTIIQKDASTYVLVTSGGAEVEVKVDFWRGGFDGNGVHYLNMKIQVPASMYKKPISGLCGSFDDDASNDRDGLDSHEFGMKQKVSLGESLFNYPTEDVPDIREPVNGELLPAEGIPFAPLSCPIPGAPELPPTHTGVDVTQDVVDATNNDNVPEPPVLVLNEDFKPDYVPPAFADEEAETLALDTCGGFFKTGKLYSMCIALGVPQSDIDRIYSQCIEDAQMTGDVVSFALAAAGTLSAICEAEVKAQKVTEITVLLVDEFGEEVDVQVNPADLFACPNMCGLHGECTTDGCVCSENWAGEGCNEDVTQPLHVSHVAPKAVGIAGGDEIQITGNFIDTRTYSCEFTSIGKTVPAQLKTSFDIRCIVPASVAGPLALRVTDSDGRSSEVIHELHAATCKTAPSRKSLVVGASGVAYRCFLGKCMYHQWTGIFGVQVWERMDPQVYSLLGYHSDGRLFGVDRHSNVVVSTNSGDTFSVVAASEWDQYCSGTNGVRLAITTFGPESAITTDHGSVWHMESDGVHVNSNAVAQVSRWTCVCK